MARRLGAAIGVVFAAGLTVVGAAGCSSGSTAATGPATGSVTCRNITGSADFSPPLTLSGTAPETTTIDLTATRCTTSGSDVSQVTSGAATTTDVSGTSSCVALLNSRPLKVTVTWDPASIEPSVVSFSGYSPTATGGTGFLFPGSGTTKVTGSFAGPKGGAGSSAAVYTTDNTTQILAACGTPAGLASIPISSGNLTLG